ncbi:unnamed protein product [Larinioides sclopetarius]|uniref:Uncharacterized protein n=1 Tax=Larinioides sclopetarius TaxID=280406 RepID=A0AAV1ZNG5_9ARAC
MESLLSEKLANLKTRTYDASIYKLRFDVTAPFEFEKIRGGCFPLNCPLV